MKRLTLSNEKGVAWFKDNGLNYEPCEMSYTQTGTALRKLAEYEDLEEAGRLVRLRVGIGDIVYAVIGGKVVPMEIQYIYVSSKGRVRYHAKEAVLEKNFREPAFGRDVFLTREEAERKVAEDGTAQN